MLVDVEDSTMLSKLSSIASWHASPALPPHCAVAATATIRAAVSSVALAVAVALPEPVPSLEEQYVIVDVAISAKGAAM